MDKTAYLVSSTSLPGSTITPVETPWQGMNYKFGSVQTFDDWTCTFRVDAAAQLRKDLKAWQNLIHDPATNVSGVPSDYFADQTLVLLDNNGDDILTMTLVGAWPTSVGEIALDYGSTDVATLDCTFSFQRTIEN
jgi:hypothetical protein